MEDASSQHKDNQQPSSLKLRFYKTLSPENTFPLHPESEYFLEYKEKRYGITSEVVDNSFYIEDLLKSQDKGYIATVNLRSQYTSEIFDKMMKLLFGTHEMLIPNDEIISFLKLYEEFGKTVWFIWSNLR